MSTFGSQVGSTWHEAEPFIPVHTSPAALVPTEALLRFTVDAMAELVAVERALTVIHAGLAGADALRGTDGHFRAIADVAAAADQARVQEVALEAETLVVAYLGRPKSFGSAQADVVQHVVDVLSLLVHDVRRRLDAKPAANVHSAAVIVRDRMRYAMREMGGGPR
jgi:hypothetical protein